MHGSHPHELWGIVRSGNKRTCATALEVHYPKALCEVIVKAFTLRLIQLGLQMDTSPPSLYHAAKVSTGKQVVSMKLPPTVPLSKRCSQEESRELTFSKYWNVRAVVLVVQLVSRHSCVADRLPVVVRLDPLKGNGLGPKKIEVSEQRVGL